MVADISSDRFDTWPAELGVFMCQTRKTDKQSNSSPDIAVFFKQNKPMLSSYSWNFLRKAREIWHVGQNECFPQL